MVQAQDALELTALKARYFEALDMKRWDRLRALFSDGARFEGFAFRTDGGPDEYVATVSAFLERVTSSHQGFTPHFVDRPDGRVRGRWTMHDYLSWEPGALVYKGIEIPGMCGIHGYGYYEEEYVRGAEGWRIDFSRLVRTRIEPILSPALRPDYEVIGPDPDWLSA